MLNSLDPSEWLKAERARGRRVMIALGAIAIAALVILAVVALCKIRLDAHG